MRKITILTWAVVLLAVMNMATIATILYHNYNERMQLQDSSVNTGYGTNPLNGKFFRQLGFDEVQMDVFRQANSRFRPAAFEITAAIDSFKTMMFTALQQRNPDSLLLNNLSDQIGNLHSRLKKETWLFYTELKKICTTKQLAVLDEAFRPLFINDAITTPFGPRQRRGRQGLNN